MADYFFRPHHLLCNYCFIGEGYNNLFIKNLNFINSDLKKNASKVIQIIKSSDDICGKCNYNKGMSCEQEKKVKDIDTKHLEVLNLSYNQKLTWFDSLSLIKSKVNKENFYYMCNTCEWYSKGICYTQIFNIK